MFSDTKLGMQLTTALIIWQLFSYLIISFIKGPSQIS